MVALDSNNIKWYLVQNSHFGFLSKGQHWQCHSLLLHVSPPPSNKVLPDSSENWILVSSSSSSTEIQLIMKHWDACLKVTCTLGAKVFYLPFPYTQIFWFIPFTCFLQFCFAITELFLHFQKWRMQKRLTIQNSGSISFLKDSFIYLEDMSWL